MTFDLLAFLKSFPLSQAAFHFLSREVDAEIRMLQRLGSRDALARFVPQQAKEQIDSLPAKLLEANIALKQPVALGLLILKQLRL